MINEDEKIVRHFHFQKETTYIEKQEITVEAGGIFYNGPQSSDNKKEGDENEYLILQLMPICMDNEEYAREFLEEVRGKNAREITDIVKVYRENKKVSPILCHRNLWQVLHENGIYKMTERNWNERIKY